MNAVVIPDIDLAAVTAREPQALEALRVGARDVGFLTVRNTGMTAQDVEAVMAAYRAFFKQPDAVKSAVDMAATGSNRGWGAPKSEQVDPDANPDYKEVFDCGYEVTGSDLSVYAHNLWPAAPEGFRDAVQSYYAKALDVAMEVLRGIATVMGEDAQYFDDKFDQPMALLRGNFYPARPDWAGDRDFGIAAHTDYGCVTLLATDGVAGLEVLGRDGAWHAVSAAPGRFVINFGEMLEMWTEGRVKATLHRVRGTAQERISVPLFFNPNYETNVAPKGAAPISAGEHLTRRFEQTYLHLKDKS
ncbi:isopenicillin N synthase family dioxygenase [Celeribacter sp.]|uniref:isopenicillin N synthase family dioxygenase n=1 Tax=Celeribacter sp. TaxID=1890673 RepID=UPI003A92FD8B